MMHFNFRLANPWAKENFKNLFCKGGLISKNTAWEVESIRHSWTLLEVSIAWSTRQDHAGPSIELGLLGYSISAKIYDTRHWDYVTGDWEVYD